MTRAEVMPSDFQDDPEFIAVQEAVPTVAKLGEVGMAETVEVKNPDPNPIEVELTRLLEDHPHSDLVEKKFDEALEIFSRYEKQNKLTSNYDALEGPTISLTNTSAGMVRLHELSVLNSTRFEEERATIDEIAYVKILMDKNSNSAISGILEGMTLEILKLKTYLHVLHRRQEELTGNQ